MTYGRGFMGVESPRTAALSRSTILVGGDSRYPPASFDSARTGPLLAARRCRVVARVSHGSPLLPLLALRRLAAPKRPGILTFHPRTSSLQHTLGAEGQSSSTIVSKRFHHRIVLSSRRYLFHTLYCSLVRSLYPFLDLGGKRHQLVGRLNLGTFGTILYLAIRTDRPRQ